MERNVTMAEISDGKLYSRDDMVKAGCDDCRGCSACCHGMGNSIVLDPYDVYRLTTLRGDTLEHLLEEKKVEWNVVDGQILPNLALRSRADEACGFLDEAGRCRIHAYRPGICRLFPLGRFYENGSFQYFLQIHECKKENRTKVKVKKWIDTPDLKRYEAYISRWHYFLKDIRMAETEAAQNLLAESCIGTPEEQEIQKKNRAAAAAEREKRRNLLIMKLFYLLPYDGEKDFYEQFEKRMQMAERSLR